MNRLSLILILILTGIPVPAQTPDLYDPDTIRDLYLTFPQANYWSLLTQNYSSQTEIPADLAVDGTTYTSVGVRFRGNSSYFQLPASSEKRSFNIRLDSFTPGQKLLGYDHLNLNNGYHDPTFVREFLAYRVSRMYGLAPKANFVRLWLNGVYWGIYINVQQPNKKMMGEWFKSNEGNRYRCFPTSGSFSNGRCAFTWLGSNVSSYFSAYQVKQGDALDLMNFCNVLNNTASASLPGALPAVFSVDQFYRYAAVMNLLTNTDSYIGSGKDHYLFEDRTHGIFHCFPFDLNEGLYGSTSLSPSYNFTSSIKPAMSKTWPHAFWRARYEAHYKTIYEDIWQSGLLGNWASQYHAMIAPDVVADTKKIYTTAQFLNNLTQSVTISSGFGSTTIQGLLPHISNRSNWLGTQGIITAARVGLSNLGHVPAAPGANQQAVVTVDATGNAAAVSLFVRTVGAFIEYPMFDDGLHGDGAANDGIWGAFIPGQPPGTYVSYYVEGRTAAGAHSYLPKTAELHAHEYRAGWAPSASPLRINEFVAKNTSGIRDEANQYEDWVEIYNPTGQPVALDGYYLTDDLQNPVKWAFPAGTTVPPFGTVLVWCDEDPQDGPLHASFKLAAEGEEIGLFEPDGVSLVDSIVFGLQYADVATGRHSDAGLPWVTFPYPTPNQPNTLSSCGGRVYSALDPAHHGMTIGILGTPSVGGSVYFALDAGPPNQTAFLFTSPSAGMLEIPGFPQALLLDSGNLAWSLLPLDGSGAFSTTVGLPADPSLVGQRLILQAMAYEAATAQLFASPALEVVFCP